MSAAMSFYGILSLAPLLVLLVAVMGWWPDRSFIESSLVAQIGSVIGEQGARRSQQAATSAKEPFRRHHGFAVCIRVADFGCDRCFCRIARCF